ncbi:hypothetical protein J6590_089476, partial [Homalodisca vitripennis]
MSSNPGIGSPDVLKSRTREPVCPQIYGSGARMPLNPGLGSPYVLKSRSREP